MIKMIPKMSEKQQKHLIKIFTKNREEKGEDEYLGFWAFLKSQNGKIKKQATSQQDNLRA